MRHIRNLNRSVEMGMGKRMVKEMAEHAYDSVEEALADTARAALSGQYMHSVTRQELDDGHWLGTDVPSVPAYYNMLRHGAPQLRDRMLSLMTQIPLPEAMIRPELMQRRRRTRGEFGNEVDIHRVYQGRCDTAWDKLVMDKVQMGAGNRLVHLVVDNCAPVLVHADRSLWLGAVVMRIYEALVRMRRSVAVSVYDASYELYEGPPYHGTVSVLVKDYGQPLREEQLAVVCSQAFSRAVLMPLQTVDAAKYGGNTSGMGYAISDYELLIKSAEEDVARGGNVVVIGKVFDKDQAHRAVYDFVQKHVHDETTEGKSGEVLYGVTQREEELP